MSAKIGPIKAKIGGEDRTFPLLSAESLASITERMPNPYGVIIDVSGLARWANHPVGCDAFLYESLGGITPLKEIRKMGSIADRIAVASALLNDSLAYDAAMDEENPSPKDQAGTTSTGG